MNRGKRTRWQHRSGTIEGKLPWDGWRNTDSWRKATQFPLLAINIYIGVTSYYWARHFEAAGISVYISRPGGIEGWLPVAGLANTRYALETSFLPPIYAASMPLLVAFILISPLLRKAFCSWLYPVDTLSEPLGNLGRRIFGRNFTLSCWLGILLPSLKYLLLSFSLYIVLSMPAQGTQYSLMLAYGMVIDVKMLDFFRHIDSATLIFVIVISVLSLFIHNTWCHYLRSYSVLLGLFPLLSPFKIRRNADSCVNCGKYVKNCPSNIPAGRLTQVCAMECTGRMACVGSRLITSTLSFSLQTPPRTQGNGSKSLQRQRTLSSVVMMLPVLGIPLTTIGCTVYTNVWDTLVLDHMCFQLIPKAKVIGH